MGSSSLTRDSTQVPCIGRVEFQPLDHQGSSASFIFCHLTEPNSELSIQEVLCKCWCLWRSKTAKMTDQSSSLLLSASTSPHEHCIYLVVVVQSLSHIRLFATPWTAALQANLSFITPRACSNSCPLNRWCHLTVSSSVISFSCLQPFLASRSFPMSCLFPWSGHSIGTSEKQFFQWVFRVDFP